MAIDFRTWLSRQAHRDSPLGDLANDALSKAGGWTGDCPDTLALAMSRHACHEARETFKRAVKSWKRYNRAHA